MNGPRSVRETLTKKLGKINKKKIVHKTELSENKSQYFDDNENKEKTKNVSCRTFVQNVKKIKLDSEQEHRNATILNTNNVSEVKNTSRKLKPYTMKDLNPALKLVKINLENIAFKTVDMRSTTEKIVREKKWEPQNWKQMLENIRYMRLHNIAPVDTMGCHKCADENCDEKTQRFHKLVALMLSSQTKDETTYRAMVRLREYSLTPEVISNMKLKILENILHPVSFYKNKAKYLQQTSKILIEKYKSDIPNNVKDLLTLPGVGPKMAHICMATAWCEVSGIGVDVHVHRIANRIGWLQKPTKDPEQTRLQLEAWLPKNLWTEINQLLVGFGQTTCTQLKPNCIDCLNYQICPSSTKTKAQDF